MSLQSIVKNINAAVGNPAVLSQELKKARKEGLPRDAILDELSRGCHKWLDQDDAAKAIVEATFSATGQPEKIPHETLMRQWAEKAVNPRIKLILHQGNAFAARVKDEANRILEEPRLFDRIEDNLAAQLCQTILKETGETLSPRTAKELLAYWRTYAPVMNYPQTLGRIGGTEWALHRPTFQPDANCPMPHFQAWLDRLSDPKAFGAFWHSAQDDEHRGRQSLWLYGPNGEDGKSTMLSLLGNQLFGPSMEVISSAMFATERRFLFASFEHARLVIYPDANNTAILHREEFKMICSGGRDSVPMERKGEMPYRGVIAAQMAIASNFEPVIEDTNHSRSRVLLIEVDPLTGNKDPRIEQKLIPELPGFLAYCEDAYRQTCPDRSVIRVNERVQQHVDRLAAQSDDRWENLIDKHFVIHEDADLSSADLQKICAEEDVKDFQYNKFLAFLLRKYGVKRAASKRSYPGIGRKGPGGFRPQVVASNTPNQQAF